MNTLLRIFVPFCLLWLAACSSDPKQPAPPTTPPVEVSGGPGVVFSDWRLEGQELVGNLRLEGDWAFTELTVATVPLDAANQELARATFEVPTPATGHTQSVRIPMPPGATRVKLEVTRTSLLTCENAVAHALEVALKDYGAQPTAEELAEMRGQVISNCGEQEWSADFLACLMKVGNERDIANCENAYAPTAESLQAKEERPDCLEISKRRTTLARKAVDTDAMDAESKEFFERMLASNEREVVRSCVADSWSDEVMLCMRDAATAGAFEDCRPATATADTHNPMAGRSACQTTAEHLGKLIRAEMAASLPPAPGPAPTPPPALKEGQSAEDPEVVAAQQAYQQALADHQAAVQDHAYRKQEQAYFVSESISRFAAMCTDEKWSADARSCVQRARSVSQLGPCEDMLYGDQD
jgi:hypothetical protein